MRSRIGEHSIFRRKSLHHYYQSIDPGIIIVIDLAGQFRGEPYSEILLRRLGLMQFQAFPWIEFGAVIPDADRQIILNNSAYIYMQEAIMTNILTTIILTNALWIGFLFEDILSICFNRFAVCPHYAGFRYSSTWQNAGNW